MRSTDIKEGSIYYVTASKFRDENLRDRCYARVLAGPLPCMTRGRFEFEMRFLTGPFSGQVRRVLPSSILDPVRISNDLQELLEMLEDTSASLTQRADGSPSDVQLSVSQDGVRFKLTADTKELLPEIMNLIATKQTQACE